MFKHDMSYLFYELSVFYFIFILAGWGPSPESSKGKWSCLPKVTFLSARQIWNVVPVFCADSVLIVLCYCKARHTCQGRHAKHVTPVELDTAKYATLGYCKSSMPQSSVQQWQALAHKSNRCADPHKTVTSHKLCELQSRLPTPTPTSSLAGGGPLSFEVWCPYLGTAVWWQDISTICPRLTLCAPVLGISLPPVSTLLWIPTRSPPTFWTGLSV